MELTSYSAVDEPDDGDGRDEVLIDGIDCFLRHIYIYIYIAFMGCVLRI